MTNQHRTHARKRLLVDPKVQGTLLARVTLYWIGCVVAIALLLFCWQTLTGRAEVSLLQLDNFWFHYGPVLGAALVTLPLVLIDLLRVSNRFAGPLLRCRRSLRQLARGEHVQPITLREDDFWHEFADELNTVIALVQRTTRPAENQAREADEPESLVEVGS